MTRGSTTGLRRTVVRSGRTIAFLGHYGRLFLRANVTVAWEIVTPGSGLAPAVIALRLRSRTPLEVAALAHFITLTPGTLVLEVRTDPHVLFVHGMHAADPGQMLDELHDLENRLLRVIRPSGDERP